MNSCSLNNTAILKAMMGKIILLLRCFCYTATFLISFLLLDGWVNISLCQVMKPCVVLMDSTKQEHVYKISTFENNKSNVDDIEMIINKLPITIIKESIEGYWTGEDRIFNLKPDLVIIHLNAFSGKENIQHIRSDVKLREFIQKLLPNQTKFIIYSRAENFGSSYRIRQHIISNILKVNNPIHRDRIRLLGVKGPKPANFDDASTAADLISLIKEMLSL